MFWDLRFQGLGFRVVSPIREIQMEKRMENEWDTGDTKGFVGIRVHFGVYIGVQTPNSI